MNRMRGLRFPLFFVYCTNNRDTSAWFIQFWFIQYLTCCTYVVKVCTIHANTQPSLLFVLAGGYLFVCLFMCPRGQSSIEAGGVYYSYSPQLANSPNRPYRRSSLWRYALCLLSPIVEVLCRFLIAPKERVLCRFLIAPKERVL